MRGSKLLNIKRVLFFFTAAGLINSQTITIPDHSGKVISSIEIVGNIITKEFIILREMKTECGDTVNFNLLENDRKRIQSLQLFNRVFIQTVRSIDKIKILVIVSEMWYIYPLPIFFINERDWDKISWGAGLDHLNFRGRAEKIKMLFWLGYNPTVRIKYSTPWVFGKKDLFAGLSAYYSIIRNKFYFNENIKEKHSGFAVTLGRRFGYHTFCSVTMGYQEVSVSRKHSGFVLSSSGKDKAPLLTLDYKWDHRDIKEYPRSGWFVNLAVNKVGFSSLAVDYSRFLFDTRFYLPVIGKTALAFRSAGVFSTGRIPVYNLLYFGYNERIRGHYYEKRVGESRLIFSSCFRFPILPITYIDLDDYEQLQDLQFGISGSFFIDSGVIWYQHEKIDVSSLFTGFGLGIHFHLPFVHLLRVEMAFNEKGRSELIADLYIDI